MSEVPNPYLVNIELFWPNGTRPNQNQIARVRAFDVNGPTVTDEGQSGYNPGTGGWMPVFMQNIAAFYPPRLRPNLRFQVENVQEQVVHVTQVFNEIPSGSTVKIIIGVSDELVGGGSGGSFRVSGRVLRSDGSAVSAGTARAFDVTNGSEIQLGADALGADGSYSITYTSSSFEQNGAPPTHALPNLQVRAYDSSGMLLAQAALRPSASNDETIDLTVGASSGDGERRVFGKVTNTLGLPVSGIKVEAYHVAWTTSGIQEAQVGLQVESNNAGDYSIPYDLPSVANPNGCATPPSQVNLIVYAKEPPAGTTTLSTSGLIFNAAVEQRADLVVDRISSFDDSEYQRLDARIASCLGTGDALWASLRALNARPELLEFAAKASGEPEELVRAYVRAWLLAEEIHVKVDSPAPPTPAPLFKLKLANGVSPEVLYGLVRTGLGADLRALLDVTPDGFFRSTVEAIHSGLVSPTIEPLLERSAEASLDSLLDDWKYVLSTLLTSGDFGNNSPLWQQLLLKLVYPGTDQAAVNQRKKITDAHFDSLGEFEALVSDLREAGQLPPAEEENLRFVFEMYDAVDRWYPIVASVYLDKSNHPSWTSIANLAEVPVGPGPSPNWYQYVLNSFSHSIGGAVLPGDIPGGSNTSPTPAQQRTYAQRLFDLFGKRSPQDRFASTLSQSAAGDPALQEVATFLGANPTFSLEDTNVNRYLEEHPPTTPPSPSTVAKLKQVQRVYRLTSDYTAASALVANGLDSAVKVARYNEGDFIARYADALGGLTAARDVHRVAVHYSSEVLFTLAKFHQNLTNVGGVTAVPGAVNFRVLEPTSEFDTQLFTGPSATPGRSIRRFPNWVSLFGDVNKCACKQCQTVLSPGAYLVDLLEFIDGAPKKTLLTRRPDLLDLEITCPNTDRSLPYIDLVNEVLEGVVAPLPFTLPATLANSFVLATSGDAASLAIVRQAIETKGSPLPGPQPKAYTLTEHFVVKLGPLNQRPNNSHLREWVVEDDGWRFTLTWVDNAPAPISVIPSPQTSATNDSLEVFPEHFNVAAYEALKLAIFPFNLPLALGREELSIFLKVKNAPQHEILEAFSTQDFLQKLASTADALAFLNLAPEESEALLATTPGKSTWQYWGFELATPTSDVSLPRPDKPTEQIAFTTNTTVTPNVPAWVRALSLVPVFLHRAGLTYQQLLDLLDTEFVHVDAANTGHGLHLVAAPQSLPATNKTGRADDLVECNYNNFQVAHLNEPSLRRISVFVRLWRKLGWTMREVDRYLMDIEGGELPTSLVTLAQVKRLAEELKQKPLHVFTWWWSLSTRRTQRAPKSLFDEVFLVGSTSQPEVQSLERIAQGETIGIDPSELAEGEDLRSHVRAALRLKAADIELLWDSHVGIGTTLGLEQLSSMYRVASFATALRLSVEELYDVIALTGASPFSNVADPAQIPAAVLATYASLREIRRWQSTKVSAPELRYLLTNQSEAGDAFVPSEEAFDEAAQSVATAVTELASAVPDAANLDAAVLTTQLAKLMPEDKVARALEIVSTATSLAAGPDRAFLERYFTPFLPADPEALFTAIVSAKSAPPPPTTPPQEPTPDVPTRYRLLWGRSPSVSTLAADELKQVDPALRATVVAGFGPSLFAHLFEQARTAAAFTTASELFGLARDTADRLLAQTLHSVDDTATPRTIPALEDWKKLLNGGFDTGEAALVDAPAGVRRSLLLVPRAGTYRLVAHIPVVSAPATHVTLALDGVTVPVESTAQLKTPDRTEVTFAPQALQAKSSLSIEFTYSGSAKVTLLWRIDNADPVVLPQSALVPFRREVYSKLYKAARLVQGLKLDKSELRYLVEVADIPFDLDRLPVLTTDAALPWSQLATVVDLLSLNRGVALKNQTLVELLADSAGGASLEDIAELTGWKAEDIDVVRSLFTPMPTFADPKLWFALKDAFKVIARLDLRAAQIKELLLDSAPSIAIASTVRNIFRAQFSPDSWKEVFKPLRDKLRQRQRDALVGYLTTRKLTYAGNPNTYFIDANELYSQLLIDTQMEPDTLISRLKLALNVIQLFVDRVFLGLEDQASLIELEDAKQQWVWMSRYRVWEANRKVFLYPENFIEPELRDDKTEFFKQLEDELLESEVNHERGVVALTNYLDKMNEVSNLEIVGAFQEGTTMHVVGRTRSQSRGFFYRTFVGSQLHDGNWTPWKTINLDINADTVAPVVFQGRLRLVWPNLQSKQKPKATSATVDGSNIAAQGEGQKPEFFNEVRLMWSELNATSNKWSKPRLSKTKAVDLEVPTPFKTAGGQEPAGDQPSTEPYHLRVEPSSSDFLSVSVLRTNVPATAGSLNGKTLGTFKLWYTGEDTFEDGAGKQVFFGLNYPAGTVLKHNGAEEVSYAVDSFLANDKLAFGGGWGFFDRTPDVFRIFATNFGFANPAEYRPFFYETPRQSLFAINHGKKTEPSLGHQEVQRATFSTFNHPLVRDFQAELAEYGPAGLMNRLTQALPVADNRYYDNYYYNYYGYLYLGYHIAGDNQAWWTTQRIFQADQEPGLKTVITPYPLPTVEFGYGTSFGIYNWELFFHLPMLVANQLSQNLKFEEALKWYHFVFDPRRDLESYEKTKRFVSALPTGSRYWNFLPFFANKDATDSLAETLGLKQKLSTYDQQQLTALIDDWRNDPFKPHLIARQRIAAYQKNVVMKYLDNLIAWADSLFRQDTFETINLATQLYVLADELLGKRPEVIEPLTGEPKYTFRELQARGLDDFSNAIVEVENQLVSNRDFAKESTLSKTSPALANLGRLTAKTFYFAIPRNERLDRYWDTVQDRLFKIRNSMNIDGVKRQLALFEPPIDPALLVRAAAAGLDLSSVLAQLSAPLPCYRFNVWIQKATELCNELKSFGAAFLSALEKKDSEAMAVLRQTHELKMLQLVREVRERQITEAEENITSLELTRASAELRRDEHQRRITEDRTATERTQLSATGTAGDFEELQAGARAIGAILGFIPDLTTGAVGIFPSVLAQLKIGSGMERAATVAADILGVISSVYRNKAAMAGINAGFDRRKEDWQLQKDLADKEIAQINQQIVMANIRLDIAQKELENHEVQLEQSEEMLDFMRDKFTNRDLYDWMSRELSKTYKKVYQLAFDAAKVAERTYQFELGRDDSFIRYDYVDSLRQGLLSGERLIYDLKRLDVAYLQQNKRELEIQKPISLSSLNAEALQKLRETGACELELPEALFDLDFPGHYFRRIKAVRVTIPCVTGPHTSVSAKLSLLGSAIRKESAADPDDYAYKGFSDARFVHDPIGIQSIATSSAQSDPGLFELNFRDERYLPFEGAGAISRWRLELPTALRQFDYHTISDVVLQLSYTARDAGGTLRVGAERAIEAGLNNLLKLVAASNPTGLVRAISLRQEFPDVLHRLLASPGTAVPLTLLPEHFPFLFRSTAPRGALSVLEAEEGVENPIDIHAILKADSDPEDALEDSPKIKLALGAAESEADFSVLSNPRVLSATVSKGTDAVLLGGASWTPETWSLSQSGLAADKIQDLVLLLKYTVELPGDAP